MLNDQLIAKQNVLNCGEYAEWFPELWNKNYRNTSHAIGSRMLYDSLVVPSATLRNGVILPGCVTSDDPIINGHPTWDGGIGISWLNPSAFTGDGARVGSMKTRDCRSTLHSFSMAGCWAASGKQLECNVDSCNSNLTVCLARHIEPRLLVFYPSCPIKIGGCLTLERSTDWQIRFLGGQHHWAFMLNDTRVFGMTHSPPQISLFGKLPVESQDIGPPVISISHHWSYGADALEAPAESRKGRWWRWSKGSRDFAERWKWPQHCFALRESAVLAHDHPVGHRKRTRFLASKQIGL